MAGANLLRFVKPRFLFIVEFLHIVIADGDFRDDFLLNELLNHHVPRQKICPLFVCQIGALLFGLGNVVGKFLRVNRDIQFFGFLQQHSFGH